MKVRQEMIVVKNNESQILRCHKKDRRILVWHCIDANLAEISDSSYDSQEIWQLFDFKSSVTT